MTAQPNAAQFYNNRWPQILNDPNAGSLGTIARGIDDFGKIVRGNFDSSRAEYGFVLNTAGKWTTNDDPNGYNTKCADHAVGYRRSGRTTAVQPAPLIAVHWPIATPSR